MEPPVCAAPISEEAQPSSLKQAPITEKGTSLLLQGKTTLLVSLAWMVFNMIPPYLLLHYQFIGRGTTLKIVCKCVHQAPSATPLTRSHCTPIAYIQQAHARCRMQTSACCHLAEGTLSTLQLCPRSPKPSCPGPLNSHPSSNRRLAFYLSFFVGVAALVLIWLLYPKGFDYPGAISDNITYFQARLPFLTAFGVDAHLNTKQLCASGRILWLGNLPSLDCAQSTCLIAFCAAGIEGSEEVAARAE